MNSTDKDFWKKEEHMLRELFEKLQKETVFVREQLEKECITLQDSFLSKIFPERFLSKREELESKVRDLRYSANNGVQAWFKKRIKELRKEFHVNRTEPLSPIKDKIKVEKDCVMKFYKNKGQSLEELHLEIPPEDSPIDIIAIMEDGKRLPFQVTVLPKEKVGNLLKGDIVSVGDETLKEIQNLIKRAVEDKEPKSSANIILLLPSTLLDEEDLKRAITGLSVNSSFKEIYIVTEHLNIPLNREI